MEEATGVFVEATQTGTMTFPGAILVHNQEAETIIHPIQLGMMTMVSRLHPECCSQKFPLYSATSLF